MKVAFKSEHPNSEESRNIFKYLFARDCNLHFFPFQIEINEKVNTLRLDGVLTKGEEFIFRVDWRKFCENSNFWPCLHKPRGARKFNSPGNNRNEGKVITIMKAAISGISSRHLTRVSRPH